MQLTDKDGNIFGTGGLEITTSTGKPKIPVINTDITIGTTTIVGGVAGRLLFDDAGVVSETNGVHWDKVNSRMGFGTVTPAYGISHIGNIGVAAIFSQRDFGFGAYSQITQRASYIAYTTDGTTGLAIGAASGAARIQGFNGLPATSDKPIFLQSLGGNVGIGTTTDAGFKFDVNGTGRFQGGVVVSNPSFTGQGSIAQAGDNTTVITGRVAGASENITFGPSNRIFINAQQSRFSNGSVQIASTLSVGVANTTAATMLWTTGGITASSALARGIGLDTTLVAAANNDVLVGLDIAPTFTNGAFTGVTNFGQRISQSTQGGNNGAQIALRATDGNPGIIGMQGGGWNAIGIWGVGRHNATSTPDLRIFSTGQVIINTKLFINTTADAGFAFDCNGTGRFSSTLTLENSAVTWGNLSGPPTSKLRITRRTGWGVRTGMEIGALNSNISSYTSTPIIIGDLNTLADVDAIILGFNNNVQVTASLVIGSNNSSPSIGSSSKQIILGDSNIAGGYTNGQVPGIIIGNGNNQNGFSFSQMYGTSLKAYGHNQLLFGANAGPVGPAIKEVYIGYGFRNEINSINQDNGNANNLLISPSNASDATDKNGGNLTLAGSRGTGSGNPGNVIFSTATTITTGTTLQTLSERMRINGAGNVLIGTTTNVVSSKLTVESTTQGFLPPRMTNAQMLAIVTPATGLMVYDTTNNKLCCYDGTTWQNLF